MARHGVETARPDWRLGVVSLAVAAIYVKWFPVAGTGDVDIWLGWIRELGGAGPAAVYTSSHRDYPPGGLLLLELPRMVSQASGLEPLLALKALLVLAAVAAAAVLVAWSGRPLYAGLFLLAVAVNVVAHGYLDILVAAPVFLALRALERRRAVEAGAWYAAAAAIKWQPLIIGPFVLAEACRGSRAGAGWGRALDGTGRLAAGALIVVAPLLLMFDAAAVLDALRLAFQHTSLSLQGLNVNWLVQLTIYVETHATGALYDVDAPPIAGMLARAAFSATYAVLLWLFIRRGRSFGEFVWYSCVAFYSYCMLNVGVHENHLFLAVVLAFALLCARHRDAAWVAACMSVASTVNLVLFYDLAGHWLWDMSAPMANRLLVGASVAASLLNVTLWGVLFSGAVRSRRPSAVAESSLASV